MKRKFTVNQENDGKRLDAFLAVHSEALSRNKIKTLIEEGKVSVNGKNKKAKTILKIDDVVDIHALPAPKKGPAAFFAEIPIVYEDEDIIIVDKPDDLVVHPPNPDYQNTLVNALLTMGKKLAPVSELRPGVVHRLDRETSGLLILAKTKRAYAGLVEQFKKREIKKEYRAMVWGKVKQKAFTIDVPLVRDRKNRLKMKVGLTGSKDAITQVEVIKHFKESTLLSLKLITGRMHQIRVHLKFLGYPIIGDKKYGKKDAYSQLFLHAHRLEFFHPAHGTFLTFQSPVPQRFLEFFLTHDHI
ncbi:MAG: RluA family pseudouridine synthase [Candidatus Omnitrophica bacterium]|nr:RluA family pseudouridine synthase [Candidatus Omnitrophota bacterium]